MIGYIENTTVASININGLIIPVGDSTIFYNNSFFNRDNYSTVLSLLDSGDIILKDYDLNSIATNTAKDNWNEVSNAIAGINDKPDNTYNQYVGLVLIDIVSEYKTVNGSTQSDVSQTNDLLSSLRLGLKSQSIQFSRDLHDFYSASFKTKLEEFIESGMKGTTLSIASTSTFVKGVGYERYDDSTYTEISPLPIGTGWTQLPFTGMIRVIDQTPIGVNTWINTTTSVMENLELYDLFNFTVKCKVNNTTNNNFIEAGLRVSDTGYPIIEDVSFPLIRDTSVDRPICISCPSIVHLQDIVDHGIEFYLRADSSINIYDISIIPHKIHNS